MAIFRTRFFRLLLAGGVVCVILATTHPLWLRALGNALINAEAPVKADLAVVLAGDSYGHRVLKGAELVREGYAPAALVSGPSGSYGLHECDLAIAFAVKKGYDAGHFIPARHHALSTAEEAEILAKELRRRGVRRYLLVTSNYHTARAGRIFRRHIPEIEVHVVAARDEWFDPENWWKTREGCKRFVLEWQKTVAGFIGM